MTFTQGGARSSLYPGLFSHHPFRTSVWLAALAFQMRFWMLCAQGLGQRRAPWATDMPPLAGLLTGRGTEWCGAVATKVSPRDRGSNSQCGESEGVGLEGAGVRVNHGTLSGAAPQPKSRAEGREVEGRAHKKFCRKCTTLRHSNSENTERGISRRDAETQRRREAGRRLTKDRNLTRKRGDGSECEGRSCSA